MIGVISRLDQRPVVEEFFQLFKTAWEFHQNGHRYEVVIATADDLPEVDAKLLLVCGSRPKGLDAGLGITASSGERGGWLKYRGTAVPVYGPLATLEGRGVVCLEGETGSAGIRVGPEESGVIRLGYDLFDEVRFLLSTGQPAERANVPALDIHISMLRDWILGAGIPLVEVLPTPAGHSFAVCLTHDIDFVGIRHHRFDHTMWGFLYRSTVGAVRNWLRGRLSLQRLFETWRAAASLPLVYFGWVEDFWRPFGWYLRVEKGLPTTYYLIPFKRRMGDNVPGRAASRRATAYDVTDIRSSISTLQAAGCELGVHGIDAWHSVEKAREESARITDLTGESNVGIRMHWLLRDDETPLVLEKAGYAYDSTVGYNETVGYRAGTGQVFRPLGAERLLELPMHIQDGALFYPQQLDLSEADAWRRCDEMIANATRLGGVLTVLWHDRSHAAERFWGGFYIRLVETLKSLNPWFGTASQLVDWFRKRRQVRFESSGEAHGLRTSVSYAGEEIRPPLTVRFHQTPSNVVDIPWNGRTPLELDAAVGGAVSQPLTNAVIAFCSPS